jgi:TBC1 domain family member 8/9
MVVLADELLEQFFESSFPTSLHIIDGLPNAANQSSSLTTFSNLNFSRPAVVSSSGAQPGLAGAGRGLRGVLDNIVTDASRVAAEVRRRMEEAQRELEKNALPGQRDEDDEEEEDLQGPIKSSGAYSGDAERRSVRSSDRDLLDGADADAGATKEADGSKHFDANNEPQERMYTANNATQRIVEFES